MKRSQKIQDCSACKGTGVCPECNNSGQCVECDGTGSCPECDGDGACPACSERECSLCYGNEHCPECEGTGKCIECEGSKVCPSCEGEDPNCVDCDGLGQCEACSGSGDCEECGGDGDCPECSEWPECLVCGGDEFCLECRGSGKCPECKGFKVCPECDGASECPECEGTGKVVTELVNFIDILKYGFLIEDEDISDKINIHHSLRYFEAYLVRFERFLEEEAVSVRDYFESTYPDREKGDDFLSEMGWKAFEKYLNGLNHFFPNLFRQTFFVAAYSLIEVGLRDLCAQISQRDQIVTFEVYREEQKLKGCTLKKVRTYLIYAAGITFPDTQEWSEIFENYKGLRNFVVHGHGRLDSSKQATYLVEQYIPGQPYLKVESNLVIFQRGFCLEVINTIRTFFDQIEKAAGFQM